MDIYFCDLCGSRVTSVDLRSGVGMCREEDVICSRCVELGRGPDWLSRHQELAAVPVARPVATILAPPDPSPVDIARDRARTIDKDLVTEPVRPLVVTPAPPDQEAPAAAVGEAKTTAVGPSQDAPPPQAPAPPSPGPGNEGLEITTKISSALPDFSSLASSFSALGTAPDAETHPSDAPADDLMDQQDAPEPTTGHLSKEGDLDGESPPPVGAAAPGRVTAPASASASASASAARVPKVRTSSTSNPRVNGGPSRSTASAMAKPASTKSARKNGAGVSGRSRQGDFLQSKAAFKVLLIFSIAATLITVILLYLSFCAPKRPYTPPAEVQRFNLSEDIKDSIRSVQAQAQAALQKDPPVEAELIRAREAIHALQAKALNFQHQAMANASYNEAQVEQVMSNCGLSDTQLLIRPINDKLAILHNGRTSQ